MADGLKRALEAKAEEAEREASSITGLPTAAARDEAEVRRVAFGEALDLLAAFPEPTPPLQGPGLTREDGEKLEWIATLIERTFPGVTDTKRVAAFLRQLSQRALASPQEAPRCTCEACPHPWRDPKCALHGDPERAYLVRCGHCGFLAASDLGMCAKCGYDGIDPASDGADWVRVTASSASPQEAGEGHRVRVKFEGDATYAYLLHPEHGCKPPVDEESGEDIEGEECWIAAWFEEHGQDLLFGEITVAVDPEWDGDCARLHVQQLTASTQPTSAPPVETLTLTEARHRLQEQADEYRREGREATEEVERRRMFRAADVIEALKEIAFEAAPHPPKEAGEGEE